MTLSTTLARRPNRGGAFFLFALALVVVVGCAGPNGNRKLAPGEIDPDKIETRDDIVEIVNYWPKPPWLRDANQTPVGIRPTVLFVSGETAKGAFVDGTVTVSLFDVSDAQTTDTVNRRLLHEWKLTPNLHRVLRIRRRTIQGYSYGFPLKWPETLDIVGKRIDIVIRYDRRGGGSVSSPAFRALVLPGVEESYSPSTPLTIPGGQSVPPRETIRAKPGETPRVRVKANLR